MKISSLPVNAAPDGTETVPHVKGGLSLRAPLSALVDPVAAPYVANASAAATRASLSASVAEGLAGVSYASIAAGLAATASGKSFAVTNADGTVSVYLNNAGASSFLRTVATTAALSATGGAGLVGWTSGGAGAVARTVAGKMGETISVKDFGAKGDGATDDTAAIQAAVNAIGSGDLLFPAGTYKITAAITIPFATGWRMRGAARGNTTLSQATANTPIFKLATDLTHSWSIQHLTFTWANAQPQANTSAVAIMFVGGSGGGFFNWQVSHCTFYNGFRGLATTTNGPVWGAHVHDCVFGGSMSGAAVYFMPSPSVGQPNINVENCMIDCAAIVGGSEFAVNIGYCDSLLIRNVEFLNGTQPLVLMQLSQCNATLLHVRSENYTSNASTNTFMFLMVQSAVTVMSLNVSGVLGNGYMVVLRGDGASYMTIHNMGVGGQTTFTGGLTAYYGNVLFVDRVGLGVRSSDNSATYLGYSNPTLFNVSARLVDNIDSVGDASKAMTTTSARIQSFRVTLTAARTLTLPPASGMVVGMEIEVSRQASTPGAFGLTVTDPVSGVNFYFPPNTNGFVRYRYVGGAYLIMSSNVALASAFAQGAGAPTTAPGGVGQQYVDTTNKKIYVSTGTSAASDWTVVN